MLSGAERTEGVRNLAVIPVAILTGQLLPWVRVFDTAGFREGQTGFGFGPPALARN